MQTKSLLINNSSIRKLRKRFTNVFFKSWEEGFSYYIGGKWKDAGEIFEKTKNMIEDHVDGPSVTLFNYIQRRDFTAPSDWRGVRKLTSK